MAHLKRLNQGKVWAEQKNAKGRAKWRVPDPQEQAPSAVAPKDMEASAKEVHRYVMHWDTKEGRPFLDLLHHLDGSGVAYSAHGNAKVLESFLKHSAEDHVSEADFVKIVQARAESRAKATPYAKAKVREAASLFG